MASDSFHRFAFLPFELRRMIYLFASPPRFVHVQEHPEDHEEFDERLRTTPVQLTLHPSIAYFARNWRGRIPWSPAPWRSYYKHHQLTLETYGFTCPSPKHQPWTSTKDVPGIPHHFLLENPEVAWEFVRSGSFYSVAPIPVMLHVTRESRQVLIDYGYELAFRTRTCGPRTWFNFKTDILFIGLSDGHWTDGSWHSLLSGNTSWDIGQFEPIELKKVRRLALGSSGHVVSSPKEVEQISSILELFTDVAELFLEESGLDIWDYEFARNGQPGDTRVWCYTPALEVDVLATPFEHFEMVHSTGWDHRNLKAYKEQNMGDGTRYFTDAARNFEEKLMSRRDELVRGKPVAQWRIPKIQIVYIGPQSMCRGVFKWRWKTWNRFMALKEEKSRSNAAAEAQRSIDVPKRPIYHRENSPPSPFTEQYRDDMEAFEEMHGEILDVENRPFNYAEYDEESHVYRRCNWILSATVAPPWME